MSNDDYRRNIVNYLKKNLLKGYTPESLRWALIEQGYSRTAVEVALEQAHKEMAEKAPILKEKPIIKHEILDVNDNPIEVKKPFWKKIFG